MAGRKEYIISAIEDDALSDIYMVDFEHGISALVEEFFPNSSKIFVVDSKVRVHHGDKIDFDESFPVFINEKVKSLDRVYELYSYIYQRYNESNVIVAVGGGSLMDLVGFTVNTFGKEMKLVLIPTTLGSQLLPFINGRFCINFDRRKDILSVKAMPDLILIDPKFTSSQRMKSLRFDLSIALSTGLTCDENFYRFVGKNMERLKMERLPDILKHLIEHNVRLRMENRNIQFIGERTATIFQDASKLMISYSQALGFGILMEALISFEMGFTPYETYEKVKNTVRKVTRIGRLPIDVQSFHASLDGRYNMRIPFILKPGRIIYEEIPRGVVSEIIKKFIVESIYES